MTSGPVGEAVGVFQDEPSLQAAVDELLMSGFDRSDISVVAGRRSVERRFGAMYDDVTDLEDAPEAPVTVYVGCDSRTEAKAVVVGGLVYVGAVGAVGAVVASGGTLAAAFAAAAIVGGVGGLIGGAISKRLDRHHAKPNVVGGVSYGLSFMNRIACKAHEKAGSFEIMPVALRGKGA